MSLAVPSCDAMHLHGTLLLMMLPCCAVGLHKADSWVSTRCKRRAFHSTSPGVWRPPVSWPHRVSSGSVTGKHGVNLNFQAQAGLV